jgi:TonB family protein
MTLLVDLALRSSVPVLASLLACLLLRRRSAALRHTVLAAAVVAVVMVVPLSVILPPWDVTLPTASVKSFASPASAAARSPDEAGVAPVETPAFEPVRPLDVALFAWIAGVVIATGVLLLRVARLVRLSATARTVVDGPWRQLTTSIAAQYGIDRPIVLLTTPAPDILATWGVLTPRVLLPAQALTWSEERVRVALYHELAHIVRLDWPIQVGADIIRILFWFNPLFWMLSARLRHEAERACDDAVLATGLPTADYASHVVEIAKACRQPSSLVEVPAVSIARPSTLEGRVTAMLNNRLDRHPTTRRAMAAIIVALAVIVIPAASMGMSAQNAGPMALTGQVYDTTGSVLPAVEMTLVDERLLRWSAVTDGSGRFEFTPVGTGTYVLEVVLPGFRPLRSEFTLSAARDWTRNITMQVGALEETVQVTARRPAQPAPVSAVPGARPVVRVGGNIRQPRKLKHANPVYPPAMRDAGLEGVVPMEALIGLDGTVASVRVLGAQVHPGFARAAETAVRQWVFSPTLLNGVPVEVQMAVSVRFSLVD